MKTTVGAWFIPSGYITMVWPFSLDDNVWSRLVHTIGYITILWPLSLDDNNWRSMFHTLEMNNHALTVVMRLWQLTEQVTYLRDEELCPDRCHEAITTDGACFIPKGWITMLWPLSWDDDNCRSMFYTLEMNNHALTVVMSRWQLSEHVSYLRDKLPCSDRCHVTMSINGACFIS